MKRKNFVIYISFIAILLTMASFGQQNNYERERYKMVETQLKARGIADKQVLEAFKIVPRHRFVLPGYAHLAYKDSPLSINEGQTISQPYIVAFMTEALKLERDDRVLEVGTGSGYQAAILAQLCDSVFTIEIFESLANTAQLVFDGLGYQNIYCKVGDGYHGWEEKAPFDAIIVTCAPGNIPTALKDQLSEGGKMIIPVGGRQVQQLVLLQKRNGKIREKKMLPVRFVPMIDENKERY